MNATFIRSGHGYEAGYGYERCTAFDGFEILAEPLGGLSKDDQESRVFGRKENGHGGVTYGSFAIKLAQSEFGSDLYLLVQHGAGREVWAMPAFYDGGALRASILAMEPRLQYALLFTIYKTASGARSQAQQETRATWAQAFADGRLKKRRATKSRAASVEIEPAKAA